MRLVEPEPWSLGVRLRQEPDGVCRFNVAAGSAADGTAIQDLDLGEDVWISLVSRDGRLLAVRSDTVLEAGDEVLAIVDPEHAGDSTHVFTATG
jgi:cell volume regulation protein A